MFGVLIALSSLDIERSILPGELHIVEAELPGCLLAELERQRSERIQIELGVHVLESVQRDADGLEHGLRVIKRANVVGLFFLARERYAREIAHFVYGLLPLGIGQLNLEILCSP